MSRSEGEALAGVIVVVGLAAAAVVCCGVAVWALVGPW